jgi:hypothetical protein
MKLKENECSRITQRSRRFQHIFPLEQGHAAPNLAAKTVPAARKFGDLASSWDDSR